MARYHTTLDVSIRLLRVPISEALRVTTLDKEGHHSSDVRPNKGRSLGCILLSPFDTYLRSVLWTKNGTTQLDPGTSVVCDGIGRRPAPLVRRGFSARFNSGPNYLCNPGRIPSSPRNTFLRSVMCDVIGRRPAPLVRRERKA
eukprot:gene10756-19544_t